MQGVARKANDVSVFVSRTQRYEKMPKDPKKKAMFTNIANDFCKASVAYLLGGVPRFAKNAVAAAAAPAAAVAVPAGK